MRVGISVGASDRQRGTPMVGVPGTRMYPDPGCSQDVAKPYKFIGFGDIHGPKPYKFIGYTRTRVQGPMCTADPGLLVAALVLGTAEPRSSVVWPGASSTLVPDTFRKMGRSDLRSHFGASQFDSSYSCTFLRVAAPKLTSFACCHGGRTWDLARVGVRNAWHGRGSLQQRQLRGRVR